MWNGKRIKALEEAIVAISDQLKLLQSHGEELDQMDERLKQVEDLGNVVTALNEELATVSGAVSSTMELMDERFRVLEQQFIELAKRDQNVTTPDLLKYGSEPWFNMVGGNLDPSRGIQLNMDWNSAFVDQLKRSGYTGINEFQVISSWIAAVAASQQQKLVNE